jgi:hypothetical protein
VRCGVPALIAQLVREHVRGESMLAATRSALLGLQGTEPNALEGLATAVEEFAEFYWWQLHREEEQLIPLACSSLPDGDWHEIQAAFASNTDPLFGAECAAEY